MSNKRGVWKFQQIYSFGANGNKDKPDRFAGKKVKGHGHDENKYYQQFRVQKKHFFSESMPTNGSTVTVILRPQVDLQNLQKCFLISVC